MKSVDYGHGSIAKAIVRSAGPMMIAQVLSLLYNMIDRMYIAYMPQGTIAIGAVGLCFPILTIMIAFANLYGSGGGPLLAICRGRNEEQEAKQIQAATFGLILITGLVLMLFAQLWGRPILNLFGATSNNLPYAQEYLNIVLWGTVFSMLATGMNPFLIAQGRPLASMTTIAIGAVLNILLDPLFIFVWQMGVAGAAMATVISQILSAVIVCYLNMHRFNWTFL